MQKFSYKNLTEAEKQSLDLGCGGKGSWLNPPEFCFHASCSWHDWEYCRGYTEADRKAADEGFYKAMKEDVSRLPWYRRPLAYSAAWTYYKAVRLFGKKYFNYGERYLSKDEIMAMCSKKFVG